MKEGLRRIAIVFKVLGVLCLVAAIGAAISEGGKDFGLTLAAGALVGGAWWSVGWVLDGFAKKT